jgi:hypothetical protein
MDDAPRFAPLPGKPGWIDLRLTREQALVLHHWLAIQREGDALITTHRAELVVLSQLEAELESQLPDLFSGEYAARIQQARDFVTQEFGE